MTQQMDGAVDLTNCDREPIHIPGSILPHGAMLVVDPATMLVEQVAGDTLGLFGRDAASLTGQDLADVLNAEQLQRLRELLQSSSLARPRHLLDPLLRVVPDHV